MHDDFDELMSDEFLEGLDDESNVKEAAEIKAAQKPVWVSEDEAHTTFKTWGAILQLKRDKKVSIKALGKVADSKTPKSVYEIKKSEVAGLVGRSAQSIFRKSSFSKDVLTFFDYTNGKLLALHEKEQFKQKSRSKKTGVRVNKKEDLVKEVQDLREKVKDLECRQVKDTLDLVLTQMPFDLRQKLRM